jgi:hypothetical protein
VLKGIGGESEYRNDEMIDNQLRSVLFLVPRPGIPDPSVCLDGPPLPQCFSGVLDLGALDVERGRDHGIPLYNDLRRAYGLAPKPSFTAITGEATEQLPAGIGIDDPSSLDWTALRDITGANIPFTDPRAQTSAVSGTRRTALAARLKAIFGGVDKLDAFTGMLSEQHVPGTEFGELQLAMWKQQFEALRDGDRFFYRNDPELATIQRDYGISAQRTLAQLIEANTGLQTRDDVFKLPGAPARIEQGGGASATVNAALSLTLGTPASFGAFSPGVAKDYAAATTAAVISTAGDAALTVSGGRLTNGSFALNAPLVVQVAKPSWTAPASNDTTTVTFTQHVGATEPLRTGGYSAQLTFTLSTTTP